MEIHTTISVLAFNLINLYLQCLMITITKEFITPQEELDLLSHIKPSRFVRGTARNRVYRYGSKLPYNAPMQGKSIPPWLDFVVNRIMEQGLLPERPDHVTINEYQKGQSIDWHIDSKTSGPIITVLSLKSDAIMGMKDKNQTVQHSVNGRSLLQMTDKERWDMEHCIYPVEDLRYSIVFRKGTI
jgi:alkylated DNA repair dioxygenase AlkB